VSLKYCAEKRLLKTHVAFFNYSNKNDKFLDQVALFVLFTKNKTEGPGIKIGRFRPTILNSQNVSIGKLFELLKAMKLSKHFHILLIVREAT
jgi:hypothetical protein